MGTTFAYWTRLAVAPRKPDIDDRMLVAIMAGHPENTLLGLKAIRWSDQRRVIVGCLHFC
jgi:hypothetical protein